MLVLAFCGMFVMLHSQLFKATCAFVGNQSKEGILPCNITGDCPSDNCCLSFLWTEVPLDFNYTLHRGICNPMSQFKDLCRKDDTKVTNLTDGLFQLHCPCTPDLRCKSIIGKLWIDVALGEIGNCDEP